MEEKGLAEVSEGFERRASWTTWADPKPRDRCP